MNNRKRILTLLIIGVLLLAYVWLVQRIQQLGLVMVLPYGTGSTANNTLDVALGNKANVENYKLAKMKDSY